MRRIAVLVSGGGTNLQALIDAQKSGIIHSGEIVLVIANNADAYALTRAANAGIATEVVLKKQLGSQAAFDYYDRIYKEGRFRHRAHFVGRSQNGNGRSALRRSHGQGYRTG